MKPLVYKRTAVRDESDSSGRLSRRQFVTGVAAGGGLLAANSLDAQTTSPSTRIDFHNQYQEVLAGTQFDLTIGYEQVNFTGKPRIATTVNGSVPGPLLRWKEGERVQIKVTNQLKAMSSIHWHGLILPYTMDGVPHLSFAGIGPGETFRYEFDIKQNGTYWYHSHSGFQEQTGMYGAIIIDPKTPHPYAFDREYIIQLSDWSDEDPHNIYKKLKQQSHFYNTKERTIGDLTADIRKQGVRKTWQDRLMWNQMRMSDTDLSDVTGLTYTYLMNGITPAEGWRGIFSPNEKVLLRFINASAMTIFDVRIPGLKMTVVAADGQYVQPVSVDEFRIAAAETYDVIVEPDGDAYTIFAQSMDRSGYTRGHLLRRAEAQALIPKMDQRVELSHQDMGMAHHHGGHQQHSSAGEGIDHSTMDHGEVDHSKMDHDEMGHGEVDHSKMDHGNMDHGEVDHSEMDHSKMDHSKMSGGSITQDGQLTNLDTGLGLAGFGSVAPITHSDKEFGPHVDMRSENAQDGLSDPGVGLRRHQELLGRRVLTYADLKNLYRTQDYRQPSREIHLHLTGNMSRYMWSINGVKYRDAKPIFLKFGERVRFVLINDTMMTHPIHLHGMWSELETGDPQYLPKKHVVMVQPGAKASYLVTADAEGRWAFHCHLLYHMSGMAREVRVVREGGAS